MEVTLQTIPDRLGPAMKALLVESSSAPNWHMAQLEKLAPWRIKPSLIKFPTGTPEFHGGYATVSRAFLNYSPDGEDNMRVSNNAGDEVLGSNGQNLKSPRHVTNQGNNSMYREEGRENEEVKQSGASPHVMSSPSTNPDHLRGKRGELPPCVSSIHGGPTSRASFGSRNRGVCVAEDVKRESSGTSGARKTVAVKQIRIYQDLLRVLGLALREAEFLVDLSHTNIIKLEGFVEDISTDMIWLIFPWEDNGTLKDFVASTDWEIPERISLIKDVVMGVEYLHTRRPPVCHGDLKSINILVNSEYRAIITDFGSARRLVVEDSKKGRERTENKRQGALSLEATFCTSTNTITLTGNQYTLRWAAPELLQDDQSSLQTDIWALGWVAYEVMTNSIPFQDVRNVTVIVRLIRGDLPSISNDARMLLIQALCSLMIKCWSIDPKKRPTAEDCCKSVEWMPMIIPNPAQTGTSRVRSPDLLLQLGIMHRRQGDYINASSLLTEALDIWTDLSDRKGKAAALWQLAHLHRHQSEYSQAVKLISEVLQIWTDIGYREGRAKALWGLADVHRLQNEHSQAIALYSEALQIWNDLGNRQGRAEALCGLAEVHRVRGEDNQAITLYSEILQIRTDLGDRRRRADALWGLAEVHQVRGEHSQAITFFSEALQIWTDIGHKRGRAFALLGLADVYLGQSDHSNAINHYEQAAETFGRLGISDNEAYALKRAADARRLLTEKDRSGLATY